MVIITSVLVSSISIYRYILPSYAMMFQWLLMSTLMTICLSIGGGKLKVANYVIS